MSSGDSGRGAKVRCPNCDANVPLGAEFCKVCGTPTDPGMRARLERTGEPAEADPKHGRRTIFIAGAALLFGIVIGSWTGSPGPSINIDPDWDERPAVVSAQEFQDAYRRDAEAADKRFEGRGMVVTGEFLSVRKDDQGNPDLQIKGSDPTWSLGADLLPNSHGKAWTLKPGETVTVSCERVRRTGEERWLRNCSIEELAAGAIAPQASANEAAASNVADD
jgi:hypothetical protein